MKRLCVMFLACLMPLCWIQSQDITIDGTVTADNQVIQPGIDSSDQVLIDRGFLPLWFTTILELQKAETVIDSLRLAYKNASASAKYLNLQVNNLENQNRQRQKIIDNLNGQIKFHDEAQWETEYQVKKWRRLARLSMVAAGLFGAIAFTK